MKLEKTKIKSKRLFELHLIKSKIYEQPIEKSILKHLPDVNVANIMLHFKKALQVIFKYHSNDKRILFIGTPTVIETILNQKSNHLALSKSFDIKKLRLSKSLTSSIKFNSYMSNIEKELMLPKLKNKPDLIVIFDQNGLENKYDTLIHEGYCARIPIVRFNYNLQERSLKHCYGIPGNIPGSSTKVIDNIFFILVNAMLKYSANRNNSFKR